MQPRGGRARARRRARDAADAAATTASSAATTPTSSGSRARRSRSAVSSAASATSVGADLGAQARFARANRRGGVAGRTVEYAGHSRSRRRGRARRFGVRGRARGERHARHRPGSPRPGCRSSAPRRPPAWDGNTRRLRVRGRAGRVADPRRQPGLGRAAALVARHRAGLTRHGRGRRRRARHRARGAGPARRLRAAGFQVADPVALPAPPTPLPDLAPAITTLTAGSPAVVLLLTSPATTTGLAQLLAAVGFTGTVATDRRRSTNPRRPAIANGLTVLVPYAPFEQTTAANRRLAADVEAFAPGTQLTPGVAAGYWSADLFLRMLAKVGQAPHARALPRGRRPRFSFSVPSAPSAARRWPAMHTRGVPCGALVQSDGTRYLVVEPYACGDPIVRAPTHHEEDEAVGAVSRRRRGGSRPSWSPGTRRSNPSFIAPRMSVTSNQSRLRSVFAARPMPLRMASSIPSADEPTISVIL